MLGARETIRFGVSAARAEGSKEQRAESSIPSIQIKRQTGYDIDFSISSFNLTTSKIKNPQGKTP
jgi:hypothetical protein